MLWKIDTIVRKAEIARTIVVLKHLVRVLGGVRAVWAIWDVCERAINMMEGWKDCEVKGFDLRLAARGKSAKTLTMVLKRLAILTGKD